MTDIKKIVSDELRNMHASDDSLKLWEGIFKLYTEGGQEAIESNIDDRIKKIKSALQKEKKEFKEVAPKIRKKKK